VSCVCPHANALVTDSYCDEDIEFDAQHQSCLESGKQGHPMVNLSRFHEVVYFDTVNVETANAFASHS
jgi:hypothetical protein